MAIKHSAIDRNVVVTFITKPVLLETVFSEVELIASFAGQKEEWHHIVGLGEDTICNLNYTDMLTLAWLVRDRCEIFPRCYLALCAEADSDFKTAETLASLIASDRVTVAVFRRPRSAREWSPFSTPLHATRHQRSFFSGLRARLGF